MNWHQKKIDEVVTDLGASLNGLSSEDAKRRIEEYGFNELTEKIKKTPFMMILDQLKDFMILILIGAAIVAGVVGKLTDSAAILAIVALNAVIGFIQEYRAEKAMAALKMMAAPSATVLRDGMPRTVPAREIVPGDIILFEAGHIVPADMRLIESATLKIEEAALTGESVPAEKAVPLIEDEHLPIGDRKNMAYQSTITTYGRGKGIVVATGMDTELGKIASKLQEEKDVKTPLQQRLAVFGKRLAVAILIICAVVFVAGVMRGEQAMLMFLTAVSLAVAAIPEALPAVITISLALGAKKMVKQNALMRKLAAVETLGSVTYICSDKTGTLTLNKMTVEEVYVDGELVRSSAFGVGRSGLGVRLDSAIRNPQSAIQTLPPRSLLMTALALSNDAKSDASGNIIGDPTEVALYSMALNNGFDKALLREDFPRVEEIPFDSDRKCMTTFHETHSSRFTVHSSQPASPFVSFTKGAIEILIDKAGNILASEGMIPVDKEEVHKITNRMAADGLRVLGIALRQWESIPEDMSPENVEKDLTLVGFVGMMDPPREEAKEAVKLCKTAGIKVVMITGDHPLTARTIARRIGILEEDAKAVTTGLELEKLPLEEFEERVEHIRVYARVAPEQKLKIVSALQDRKQFVAMTGDGVNDAPALKRANIGIAMGITGTDVAKESSSMILLDDNFATIVKAVKEGRRIYDNILKFIKYTMTSNAGTLWVVFLAPFFGLPLPMLPIQILWMNLLCDSLPGLALTAEPAESRIMNRPPREPGEGVFAQGRGYYILKFGLILGIGALLFQKFAIVNDMRWQTMIFTGLVIGRMAVVNAVRSEYDSLFKIGLFTNLPMVGAINIILLLQLMIIYVPVFNPIFQTEPLSLNELLLTIAFSSMVLLAVELEKLVKRKATRAV